MQTQSFCESEQGAYAMFVMTESGERCLLCCYATMVIDRRATRHPSYRLLRHSLQQV